jgi:hypothetical protein
MRARQSTTTVPSAHAPMTQLQSTSPPHPHMQADPNTARVMYPRHLVCAVALPAATTTASAIPHVNLPRRLLVIASPAQDAG